MSTLDDLYQEISDHRKSVCNQATKKYGTDYQYMRGVINGLDLALMAISNEIRRADLTSHGED
jgi:hypothetical protein